MYTLKTFVENVRNEGLVAALGGDIQETMKRHKTGLAAVVAGLVIAMPQTGEALSPNDPKYIWDLFDNGYTGNMNYRYTKSDFVPVESTLEEIHGIMCNNGLEECNGKIDKLLDGKKGVRKATAIVVETLENNFSYYTMTAETRGGKLSCVA